MIEHFLEQFGEGAVLMMAGLGVGVLFGASAQHSRFCLRSASVELTEGKRGPQLLIWFVAFSTAVFAVQGLIALGVLDVSQSRQLAAMGSLSGAVIGGLMFGSGMILARGCASRLLVLSATGNLRAIVTGLVLTLVAQSSLRGALSPVREWLSGLYLVEGGASRDMLGLLGISNSAVSVVALLGLGCASWLAVSHGIRMSRIAAGGLVGLAIALGWLATYWTSQTSFEVVAVSSVTFTGPSADTLMGLINSPSLPLGFGIGLVPGVFIGSAIMAFLSGEAKIQRFGTDTPMERYLAGAVLMGFGSMLAGGCAVGAGMSGGSVFSLTAWVALFCIWAGAMLSHVLIKHANGLRSRAVA